MQKHFRKYRVGLLGYCLMPNHVHHVDIPALESSLAKGVGLLHNDYSRWQQIQRNQTGHLWQNRFYSNPMDDTYCWAALRYIELNPVRAGLVRDPWDWPWSSASAHVTGTDATKMLDMDHWGKHFDKILWKKFLLEGLGKTDELERIRIANKTGRPLGTDNFIRKLEKIAGRPLFPKKRGPKLSLAKKSSR